MTKDDKEICAEVYKTLTGRDTNVDDWNEAAANVLSEMVAKMRDCSNALDFVPRPLSWRPGLSYIVKYVFQSLRNRYTRGGSYYQACLIGASSHITEIEIKLQLGE